MPDLMAQASRDRFQRTAFSVAAGMVAPDAPLTDEQVAEFRERFDAEMAKGNWQYQVIERRTFTPEEIRTFLRECVTVVKPGETLAVRLGSGVYTPGQMAELQDYADQKREYAGWPQVMVLPGDELGVIEPGQ